MASLGEVGEGLNRVLNKAAEAGAALRTAAELAEVTAASELESMEPRRFCTALSWM